MKLDNFYTVNSVLVKVVKDEGIKKTESGLFVAETEKGQNYGVVVVPPKYITEESYKFLKDKLNIGDLVFFNSKLTYPVVSYSPNDVYMLVGIENIFAFQKMEFFEEEEKDE